MGKWGLLIVIMALLIGGCGQPSEQNLPTVAQLPTLTRQPTQTATATMTPTVTLTETATETPTPSATITDTATATITPTTTITPSETPTATPLPTSVPTVAVFDEASYVQSLRVGLTIAAGGRRILSVKVADGRAKNGERVVIIAYETTEFTQSGYVDEWIDIFSAIAATIEVDHLDVDSVSLIPGVNGVAAGILVSSAKNLMAFFHGEIDRAEFLKRLDTSTF